MLKLKRQLIHSIYHRTIQPTFRAYEEAAKNPFAVQEKVLSKILKKNQDSEYGRRYRFDRLHGFKDFQSALPLADYNTFQQDIERMMKGEKNVLTSSPIKIFERTSGSSGANKFIPYTAELLSEFSRAVSPWLADIYTYLPALKGRGSYWSISHVVGERKRTAAGTPIGFENDTEYMGPMAKKAWNILNSVPSSVARVASLDEWKWQTSLALLQDQNLGMISVWSPTFALRLMDTIQEALPELLKALPIKCSTAIQENLQREGRINARAFWPELQLISSWTDGPSQIFIPELKERFSNTPIQSKGIFATEGVLSFPLWGYDGTTLAVESHFFEFIDIKNPQGPLLLSHELQVDGLYSPVITTSGGLYRYHLKDIIRCVGFFHQTPLIKFEQKYDKISDLCGEKLNAFFVQDAIQKVCSEFDLNPRFAMLAPVLNRIPHYCLYLEADGISDPMLPKISQALDQALSSAHHYSYARQMSQLEPVTIKPIRNAYKIYESHLIKSGMLLGNIKPTSLDATHNWEQVFIHA